MELLATAGATVDVEDDAGMTPLMYAASCDHLVGIQMYFFPSRKVINNYYCYCVTIIP